MKKFSTQPKRRFTHTLYRAFVPQERDGYNPKAQLASGFTILYAVLIATLVLAVGVSLFSIVFKQLQLSTEARESYRAIFAADAALECALLHDRQHPGRGVSPFGDYGTGVDIASSLQAQWRFEDQGGYLAADVSGNGNHARDDGFGSDVVYTADGHQGGAFSFGGNADDDYLAIWRMHYGDDPSNDEGELSTNAVTVTAWVRPDGFGGTRNIIDFDSDEYWSLRTNGSNARFSLRTTSGIVNLTGSSLTAGQWYHLAGVYDGNGGANNVRIYVNGDLAAQTTSGSGLGRGQRRYGFISAGSEAGEYNGNQNSNQHFDGLIDSARVYDRPLSQDEIRAVYAQDSLQLHYSFNDGSGSTAVDSSGNGNHGTLQGNPSWDDDGQVDGAISLDGAGDYVEKDLGPSGLINQWTGDYTVTLWAEADTVSQADFTGVFSNLDGPADSNSFQIDIGADSGAATYRFNTIGGARCDITSLSTSWQFLGVRQDGDVVEVFYDEDSAPCPIPPPVGPMVFRDYLVGRNRGGTLHFFDGLVDEVRVYSAALHESEIERLYNLGASDPDFIPPVSVFQTVTEEAFCNDTDILDNDDPSNWTVDLSPPDGEDSVVTYDVNFGDDTCAVIRVEKENGQTRIISRGYNTCVESNPRRVERALRATY